MSPRHPQATANRPTAPALPERSVDDLLARLRRVEGQVRGLQRMIERDESCNDALIQVAAARAALLAIGLELIVCELRQVVAGDDLARRAAAASEVLTAIQRITHR